MKSHFEFDRGTKNLDLNTHDLKAIDLSMLHEAKKIYNSQPDSTVDHFAWAIGSMVLELERAKEQYPHSYRPQANPANTLQVLLRGAKEAGKLEEVVAEVRRNFDVIGVERNSQSFEHALACFNKTEDLSVLGAHRERVRLAAAPEKTQEREEVGCRG